MVLRAITVKGQHALHVFEKGGINISEGEGITKTKTGDRLTSPSVLVLEDGVDGDEVDRITMTHVPKQFCLSNVPAQQKAKVHFFINLRCYYKGDSERWNRLLNILCSKKWELIVLFYPYSC